MAEPAVDGVFETVPRTNHLGLLGSEGPDWKRTADFLSFTKADVAAATGVPKNSVRYEGRIPEEIRERLEQIATICELVAQHFAGDAGRTALWFRLRNPQLGSLSPRDLIRAGRYRKVLQFVLGARAAERRAGNR